MSTLVDQTVDLSGLRDKWRQRIDDALADRRRFEQGWHMAMAFAAGKHWLRWSRTERKLYLPQGLDTTELYQADRITEYRMTALGELSADDDRPELLLLRDDRWSEEYQQAVNDAVAHGWEHEWMGDQTLMDVRRLVLDLGTVAVRVRFDPTRGLVVQENVPHHRGVPVFDVAQAMSLLDRGEQLEFRDVREGRIVWDVCSPFNLLVPPGIPHERDFPWEGVVRPVPVDRVRDEYGDQAADLKPDQDVMSLLGLDGRSEYGDGRTVDPDGVRKPLKDHVWLYTMYERPCRQYPDGLTVTLAGADRKLMDVTDRLPCRAGNGDPVSGVSYFHWWRVTGRFWSRSLVQAMEDGQRLLNRRKTQAGKIIDRGMPKMFVDEDSIRRWPEGLPMEVVEVAKSARPPQPFTGVGPGPWMQQDLDNIERDLEHATGLRGPKLGENPSGVNTYSQLALLTENDQTKRQPIVKEHAEAKRRLVEASVHFIATYWGPEKQILVAGDDENVIAPVVFDATKIPAGFVVKPAKGTAKPRTQAAMLQLVTDLWGAAMASGVVQSDPFQWVDWYRRSLEAGQPVDFPETQAPSRQQEVAELENHLLLAGQDVPVMYYDVPDVHVPAHRLAQDQARIAGDEQAYNAIERHVMAHLEAAQPLPEQELERGPELEQDVGPEVEAVVGPDVAAAAGDV